jgi:PIN domain nuclease of toxin-antitoxin system
MKKKYALDTCYIVWLFEHHKQDLLLRIDYVITSFNYKELLHIEHRHKIPQKVKEAIRKFEKKHPFNIVDISIDPGVKADEICYVQTVDPKILDLVRDPSDAVLVAFCIQKHYNLVTRDKHDIYLQHNEALFIKNRLELSNTIHEQ